MTSTKALTLSVTLAVAAALGGVSGFAAGGGAPASDVRLKTISSRVHAQGQSLVIEATDPVPYVATRLDALTLLLDLRNVGAEGVLNRVPVSTVGPIARVALEATNVMGSPTARLRVVLTQAVGHRVRSDRNTIVVDFDRTANLTAYPAPASQQAPDAMQALATGQNRSADPLATAAATSSGRTLSPGTAAFLARAYAQQTPTTAAGPPQEPKKYTGEPMNWNLEQADLLATLKLIQDVSGLNMIIDPGVTGKVELVLTQVPWDQTLDMVLKMNKLGYIVEDNIVRIAPLAVLADEHAQRRKLADEQALSGELTTFNKTLSYAKAAEMVPLLKVLLSTRGSVQVDPRTNTLIIRDLQSRLDQVNTLAASLDRAQPQVEIEARIVQTTSTYAKALGIQWGFNGNVSPALGNTTSLAFPNNGSLGGRTGIGQGPQGTETAVNLPASGATSAVGMALGSINGAFNLDAALTALETDGHGKLLSTPKVSTLNNVEAEIAQGVQIPYQTTANNTVVTEFKDAALILRVLPQITDAGTVIMRIAVDKGSVGPTFGGVPSINTQRANTTVLVNDGETTVIGGIFEGDERRTVDSTPGLSRIPILKWLFKRESLDEQNTELLIFITPRIVRR